MQDVEGHFADVIDEVEQVERAPPRERGRGAAPAKSVIQSCSRASASVDRACRVLRRTAWLRFVVLNATEATFVARGGAASKEYFRCSASSHFAVIIAALAAFDLDRIRYLRARVSLHKGTSRSFSASSISEASRRARPPSEIPSWLTWGAGDEGVTSQSTAFLDGEELGPTPRNHVGVSPWCT
jgi:hypothetical protein